MTYVFQYSELNNSIPNWLVEGADAAPRKVQEHLWTYYSYHKSSSMPSNNIRTYT